ncbi:PAC2 family protein, partial [Streptomyces sp. 2BBP-J2]|nr:PAC2 family protein [Streptomyces sp. 2BBP-J2]
SVALLGAVGEAASLVWDLSALHEASTARRAEIGEQIADSADVREVVSGLEQQYDAFESGRTGNLLADDAPLPSGDELGAQFEQFLAELDDKPED